MAGRIPWFTFAAPSRFYAWRPRSSPGCGLPPSLLRRRGCTSAFSSRRPTPRRARRTASSSSTCRRHGCRCSSTSSWRAGRRSAGCSTRAWPRCSRARSRPPARSSPSSRCGPARCGARPTWGTWWVWDARLTSELILLFLYLGYIALVASIDDVRRGDKAGRVAGHRRSGQHSDHLFLGALVEHAAPGRDDQPDDRAQNGQHHADRNVADDVRVLGLYVRGRVLARAGRGHRARVARRLGARAAGSP